ncbi:MAG: response regulator [Elusimicrobiales bacterium]|jgi:DNA-binding response OmpR family regulator|nr:response regulator [Elusimicrobiales bacterium]NLH39331.1 response regulator [Elusimicrobiota bacterium]
MNKVLIVDDDTDFIDTLKDSIKERMKNIDVICAKNVKEAISVLTDNIPDLIISDVQLGDMHGIDFLKIIKNSKKLTSIPVIMISAKYLEPNDRVSALKAGAVAYFSKPFDVEKLCDEIKYYVKE